MANNERLQKFASWTDWVIQNVRNTGGYGVNLSTEVNKYRLLERQVNQLAAASGMSDTTYKAIFERLVQKAAGTDIEVLQIMKEIFESLGNTVNFQDPVNVNAIFGAMDKVNENIAGPGMQAWVKENLIPTIKEYKDLGLNPKQMTNLLNNAVQNTIGGQETFTYIDPATNSEVLFTDVVKTADGKSINRNTGQPLIERKNIVDTGEPGKEIYNLQQSALAQGTDNWQDYLGWKGDKFRRVMDTGQKIRNTLTPITLAPDEQQKLQALMGRELTSYQQAKLRSLLGWESGLSPYTMLGLEDARAILNTMANMDPNSPAYQALYGVLGPLVQTGTAVTLSTVEPGHDILYPDKGVGLGDASKPAAKKVASNKKGLRVVAQIAPPVPAEETRPSYNGTIDPTIPTDKFVPQNAGEESWKKGIWQSDVTSDAAAQGQLLEIKALRGQQLAGVISQIENKNAMWEQHLEQFGLGLSKDIDVMALRGVVDENIIAQIRPLTTALDNNYHMLWGLYEQAEEELRGNLMSAMGGYSMSGTIQQIQARYDSLTKDKTDLYYKMERLDVVQAALEDVMKQKLQEGTVTDTLSELDALASDVFGSSIVSGSLAASKSQEGKYLMDAAEKTSNPVMKQRLKQRGIAKITEGLKQIDKSAQSPTSPNTRQQMMF